MKTLITTSLLVLGSLSSAANLSPTNWPTAERERLEKLESQTMSPLEKQSIEGSNGIVSATCSPVAAYAGIQALKRGGNAADAAKAVAPLLNQIFAPPPDNGPKHSDAIVVVDKDGNIAAITHTINAVIWGDTGIVVDGIPLPDSAGLQQYTLAQIKPGDRVPHQITDTFAFEGNTPVLATGCIGSSELPETIRLLLGVLGQHHDLSTDMAAPPLLQTFDASRVVSIPQGAYGADFIATLKALGLNLTETPAATANALRGTLAAVTLDPKTGKCTAINQPGIMVFNSAE